MVEQAPVNINKVIFFFLFALIVRLAIGAQDISYIDRIFLPDDTYYTLSISKNIYDGGMPSTDGKVATSGFQPLISLFQMPFFALGLNQDQLAKASVFISAIIGSLSTIVIGLVLTTISGSRSAMLGMGFFAVSPAILLNDLNGLETSLSGLCCLLLIYQLCRCRAKPQVANFLLLGMFSTLALLSRIDSALLVLVVGLFCLKEFGFKHTFIVAFSSLVSILPWWSYLYLEFGSFLPESGKAVKQLVEVTVLTYPESKFISLFSIMKLADIFTIPSLALPLQALVRLFILGSVAYLIWKGLKRQKIPQELMVAGISALLMLVFYTFYLPAYWFFERYYYWIYVVILLFISFSLSSKFEKSDKFFVVVFVCASLSSVLLFFSKPEAPTDWPLYGPKGYRDTALFMHAKLPETAKITAMQSGALNYFSSETVEVLNLDGVVNQKAYLALKNKTYDKYLSDNSIEYFADWPILLEMLSKYSNTIVNEDCAENQATIKQGTNEMRLYKISDCFKNY